MGNKRTYLHFEYAFLCFERHGFTKDEILANFDISIPTFNRSIADFRAYLAEHHPDYELVYYRETKRYVLEKVTFN